MQNNEITIPMEEYKELLCARAVLDTNIDFRFFLQETLRQTIHEALCDIKEGGVNNAE